VLAPSALSKALGEPAFLGVPALFAAVVIVFDRARRRRTGLPPADGDARFPWEPVALLGGVAAAYFVTRAVMFKLYLPQRQLTHSLAFLIQIGLPLLAWCAARALVGARRVPALVIASGLSIVPTFVLRGDGLGGASAYKDYGADAPVFRRIKKLPLDAVIAGDNYIMDHLGQMTFHTPYANRTLTHPFRKGYYDETERRLELMNRTLFATAWEDVVSFGEREHVDYFIYNLGKLKAPEVAMHEPAKKNIAKYFAGARNKGFVLATPPAEAIVFRARNFIFLDLKKLAAWNATRTPP
jgi:hypothetical protein